MPRRIQRNERPAWRYSVPHLPVSVPATSVGIGKVLDHIRTPDDISIPRIVEFQAVSKTYHEGTPKAFTAIRDVNFAVADLPSMASLFACWAQVAAARVQSCG